MRLLQITLLCSTFIGSCGDARTSTASLASNSSAKEYLVELQDGTSLLEAETEFAGHQIVRRYSHVFHGFSVVMDAGDASLLAGMAEVKKIHPVQQYHMHGVQKNPRWNLDWADQTKRRTDHIYAYRATGKGIIAYTVDSGVFAAHPDFEGRARAGADFTVEKGTPLENVDGFGHGTHVAGLLGSKTYGIAKEVEIVAVKVFDRKGNTADTATVLAGLDWIIADRATHGKPSVVNMSLGGKADEVMDEAVRKLVENGLTVIASAGNDNSFACDFSPAREPLAITVTGAQSNALRPLYANFGRCVDMIAPGEGVTSTWNDGKTMIWGGTSQSAPQVTGAAAIYLEEHPAATPKEIADFLIAHTINNGLTFYPKGTPLRLLSMLWNLP